MIQSLSQVFKPVNTENQKNHTKKYTAKKRFTYALAVLYDKLAKQERGEFWEQSDWHRKAQNLRGCGETLTFAVMGDETRELVSALFCQMRMCPMCSWRRSRRIFKNVLAVISQPEFKNQDFIFLTLTMKNVPAEGLDAALDTLLGGFNSLTSNVRQPFRVSFTGLFRAVEVTYNRGNGTYHPHLHVLASVSEGYFKKSNAHYMSREKLQRLWQKAVDADYKPMVGIQRVRGADYKPIAEVAKYTVKTAAIHSPEVLRTFDRSLHKRRLIAYVGLFKDVKRRLKLRDEEDENAGSEKTKEILCNPFIVKELYKWNFGTKTYRLVEEA